MTQETKEGEHDVKQHDVYDDGSRPGTISTIIEQESGEAKCPGLAELSYSKPKYEQLQGKSQLVSIQQQTTSEVDWDYILPPPDVLNNYDDISKNVIVEMAKETALAKIEIEKRFARADCLNSTLIPILSASFSFVFIVGGVVLILNGKDIAGFTVVLTPLASELVKRLVPSNLFRSNSQLKNQKNVVSKK